MFIVYGSRSTVGQYIELEEACPFCGEGKVVIFPYYDYLHAFFIPMIPFGMSYLVTCPHCQSDLSPKSLQAGKITREMKDEMKKVNKRPIWHWVGIVAIAAFFAWAHFTYG